MPQMTVDDKTLPIDLPFLNTDFSKQEDLENADSKEKALVPFDPLQRYLAEIRRFPLLSREEEHKLAVEFKEFGNIEAAYKLVT
jgi:RNA polymerase sigma-32 factor